mmetsp:Transcript_5403/g.6556  ORF Transcript_5403/g.6556 Transcript_5403/m.6556 type:complete len:84 (-) Transcript_5403:160-411(-)
MRAADKPIERLYDWAMAQVVKLQGDTDTNCAIVGGAIGAYVGLDRIDTNKVRKVLECKLADVQAREGSDVRPKFVLPGEGCID